MAQGLSSWAFLLLIRPSVGLFSTPMNAVIIVFFILAGLVVGCFVTSTFSSTPSKTPQGSKTVILDDVSYKVDTRQYGFSGFKFSVNGEAGNTYISDKDCVEVEAFKEKVKEAIEEYKARQVRETAFKQWDGTI